MVGLVSAIELATLQIVSNITNASTARVTSKIAYWESGSWLGTSNFISSNNNNSKIIY